MFKVLLVLYKSTEVHAWCTRSFHSNFSCSSLNSAVQALGSQSFSILYSELLCMFTGKAEFYRRCGKQEDIVAHHWNFSLVELAMVRKKDYFTLENFKAFQITITLQKSPNLTSFSELQSNLITSNQKSVWSGFNLESSPSKPTQLPWPLTKQKGNSNSMSEDDKSICTVFINQIQKKINGSKTSLGHRSVFIKTPV